MLVYRDMTFCYSDCQNRKCERHQSHIDHEVAEVIAYCDLSKVCEEYQPNEVKEVDGGETVVHAPKQE